MKGNLSMLQAIEQDPSHHLAGPFRPPTPLNAKFPPNGTPPIFPSSEGLWSDLKTMRWMHVPASSFQMLLYPTLFYLNYRFLQFWNLVPGHWPNPFEPLLFISHAIPESSPEDPRYRKGYLDLVFVAYYVIFWSFVRQSITLYLFRPLAHRAGITKPAKVDRFGEQGYAVIYFSFTTLLGLGVMSKSPTWWYKTEHFWREYPHWQMTPLMKTYYLLHSAYWSQQLLVLALRLEKPRKDYTELVIHHIVTLWLIGWSYLINLTVIGNAVFISMDVSDIWLALTKICNYLQLEMTKHIAFSLFLVIWTYFRHWLNLVMLWSVWTEYDLIPEYAKMWNPSAGVWLPHWMKYQVFVPLVALQVVNLFWYFLIWRILARAVISSTLDDERSEDEGENKPSRPNGTAKSKKLRKPSSHSIQTGNKDDKDDKDDKDE